MPTSLPTNLVLSMERPSLSDLPPELKSGIEDMLSLRYTLGHFVQLMKERDALKTELQEAGRLAWKRMMRSPAEVSGASAGAQDCTECHDFIVHAPLRAFHVAVDTSPDMVIPLCSGVDSSDRECNRLALECQLLLLQAALDRLGGVGTSLGGRFPLIRCLRCLRNVVVHCRNIGANRQSFRVKVVDEEGRDEEGPPRIITYPNSWFFVIQPGDLSLPRGKLDPGVEKWFEGICGDYPASYLFDYAVQQLCEHFTP